MARKQWPTSLKDDLIRKQGGICWICDLPCSWEAFDGTHAAYPTFEHIVPLSAGGADEIDNLAITHRGCNEGRRA